jgi:hypothetical protein
MAFYRDFSVVDSFERVQRGLREKKGAAGNTPEYRGKPWYKLSNDRATGSPQLFSNFYGRDDIRKRDDSPTRPVSASFYEHGRKNSFKGARGLNPGVRHGVLTPLNTEKNTRRETIDGSVCDGVEGDPGAEGGGAGGQADRTVGTNPSTAAPFKNKSKFPKKQFSALLRSGAAHASLIAKDHGGQGIFPKSVQLDSSLREDLSQLREIGFEEFRKEVHRHWQRIKEHFLRRNVDGVYVWKDFLAVLQKHCRNISGKTVIELLLALPGKFQREDATIRYDEFVEYFGHLSESGLVIEPDVMPETARSEQGREDDPDEQKSEGEEEGEALPYALDDTLKIGKCEGRSIVVVGETRGEEATKEFSQEVLTDPTEPGPPSGSAPDEKLLRADIADKESGGDDPGSDVEGVDAADAPADRNGNEMMESPSRHHARIAKSFIKYEQNDASAAGEGGPPGEDDAENRLNNLDKAMKKSIDYTSNCAAVMVQASTRGFLARKREKLRRALSHYVQREERARRNLFVTLKKYVRRIVDVRYSCRRQLYKWRRYTGRMKRHRTTFRICFWPFRTWRLATEEVIYSRQKALNAARIFNSYWMLVHFKAYKRWYKEKKERKLRNERKNKQMDVFRARRMVGLWHEWASHKAIVLTNWREKGRAFAKANYINRNIFCFAVWRYRAHLQLLCRSRTRCWWASPFCLNEKKLQEAALWTESLPELPRISAVLEWGSISSKVKGRLADFCDVMKASFEQYEVRERAINRCCALRVGRVFFEAMRLYVFESKKERYAYMHYIYMLRKRYFYVFHRNVTKRVAARHKMLTKQKSPKSKVAAVTAATATPGSDLFSSKDIRNPKGWDGAEHSNDPTKRSPSPDVSLGHGDIIGDTTTNIAEEMFSSMEVNDEQRLAEQAREREMRQRKLFEAEKRREMRIKKAQEEWDEDVIVRRQLLKEGEHVSARFETEKVRAREGRVIRSINFLLDDEASGERLMAKENLKREKKAISLQHRSDVFGHMTDLRNRRGKIFVNTIYRCWVECERKYTREFAISCLRRMRIFVTQKNSLALYKRNRLKNWLRICSRLRYLDRGMPMYYNMRLRWSFFNKWMVNVQLRFQISSPGLGPKVTRRRRLLSKFSSCIDGKFALPPTMLMTHPRSVFYRWLEYVQMKSVYRSLVKLKRETSRLKTLQTCFVSLQSLLKRKYTISTRKSKERFALKRLAVDIDSWRNRFYAFYRKLSSRWTRKKHQYITYKLKLNSRKQDSYKKFEARWEAEIRQRIKLEKRMLFLEFQNRGRVTYLLEKGPLSTDVLKNARPQGNSFSDMEKLRSTCATTRVDVYVEDWVVGLGFCVRDGKGPEVELPVNGNSKGTKKSFLLDHEKKEGIVKIDVDAEKIVGRIRFVTNLGRLSPWYGSYATGRVHSLSVDFSRSIDPGEIIGVYGQQQIGGISSLGALVRYPNDSCVFSHCWVKTGAQTDASNNPMEEAQFATLLRMRSCDLLESFERAKKFTRKVRATGNKHFVPTCFQANCTALGVWYFEALSRGLIRMYDNVDEGEMQLAKGQILVCNGEEMVQKAEEMLTSILEYRSNGHHNVKPYYTQGASLSREILQRIATLEESLEEGKRVIAIGKDLSIKARDMLPLLPVTKTLKNYFERLYDLALVSESLGPEAFKKRSGSFTQELMADKSHQMELEENNLEKAAAGIKALSATNGFGAQLADAMGASASLKESHIVESVFGSTKKKE